MSRINDYSRMFPPIRDKHGNKLRLCRLCAKKLPKNRSSWCCNEHRDIALIKCNPHSYRATTLNHIGSVCYLCSYDTMTKQYVGWFICSGEIHHVVMVQDGGKNDVENLVLLCHDCHIRVHKWLRMVKKILEAEQT